ncbi:hypothetical protein [Leptospira dzoumogneensis]|uniref:Uncharacterized protein n=1 Tax=Leptospira dzoumogneensis TaxID=2484904 RepID=A0A4Z1AN17_9LEPT|nr:hypothetical protein [Leptospira dzoumogneensis]TGM99458.1 hypothetical protein EHR06_09990 [Leptospira dzoumogneensis]
MKIDGGMIEEEVDKVLEKETVKKIYKIQFSEIYKRGVAGGFGYGYLAPGYYIGSFFEYIFTIPFRTYNPSYDETFNRENIISQRKISETNINNLYIILRIKDIEFLNSKLSSASMSFPLLQIYRDFGIADEMEVLLYRENDRVGFTVVPMTEILRSTFGKKDQSDY